MTRPVHNYNQQKVNLLRSIKNKIREGLNEDLTQDEIDVLNDPEVIGVDQSILQNHQDRLLYARLGRRDINRSQRQKDFFGSEFLTPDLQVGMDLVDIGSHRDPIFNAGILEFRKDDSITSHTNGAESMPATTNQEVDAGVRLNKVCQLLDRNAQGRRVGVAVIYDGHHFVILLKVGESEPIIFDSRFPENEEQYCESRMNEPNSADVAYLFASNAIRTEYLKTQYSNNCGDNVLRFLKVINNTVKQNPNLDDNKLRKSIIWAVQNSAKKVDAQIIKGNYHHRFTPNNISLQEIRQKIASSQIEEVVARLLLQSQRSISSLQSERRKQIIDKLQQEKKEQQEREGERTTAKSRTRSIWQKPQQEEKDRQEKTEPRNIFGSKKPLTFSKDSEQIKQIKLTEINKRRIGFINKNSEIVSQIRNALLNNSPQEGDIEGWKEYVGNLLKLAELLKENNQKIPVSPYLIVVPEIEKFAIRFHEENFNIPEGLKKIKESFISTKDSKVAISESKIRNSQEDINQMSEILIEAGMLLHWLNQYNYNPTDQEFGNNLKQQIINCSNLGINITNLSNLEDINRFLELEPDSRAFFAESFMFQMQAAITKKLEPFPDIDHKIIRGLMQALATKFEEFKISFDIIKQIDFQVERILSLQEEEKKKEEESEIFKKIKNSTSKQLEKYYPRDPDFVHAVIKKVTDLNSQQIEESFLKNEAVEKSWRSLLEAQKMEQQLKERSYQLLENQKIDKEEAEIINQNSRELTEDYQKQLNEAIFLTLETIVCQLPNLLEPILEQLTKASESLTISENFSKAMYMIGDETYQSQSARIMFIGDDQLRIIELFSPSKKNQEPVGIFFTKSDIQGFIIETTISFSGKEESINNRIIRKIIFSRKEEEKFSQLIQPATQKLPNIFGSSLIEAPKVPFEIASSFPQVSKIKRNLPEDFKKLTEEGQQLANTSFGIKQIEKTEKFVNLILFELNEFFITQGNPPPQNLEEWQKFNHRGINLLIELLSKPYSPFTEFTKQKIITKAENISSYNNYPISTIIESIQDQLIETIIPTKYRDKKNIFGPNKNFLENESILAADTIRLMLKIYNIKSFLVPGPFDEKIQLDYQSLGNNKRSLEASGINSKEPIIIYFSNERSAAVRLFGEGKIVGTNTLYTNIKSIPSQGLQGNFSNIFIELNLDNNNEVDFIKESLKLLNQTNILNFNTSLIELSKKIAPNIRQKPELLNTIEEGSGVAKIKFVGGRKWVIEIFTQRLGKSGSTIAILGTIKIIDLDNKRPLSINQKVIYRSPVGNSFKEFPNATLINLDTGEDIEVLFKIGEKKLIKELEQNLRSESEKLKNLGLKLSSYQSNNEYSPELEKHFNQLIFQHTKNSFLIGLELIKNSSEGSLETFFQFLETLDEEELGILRGQIFGLEVYEEQKKSYPFRGEEIVTRAKIEMSLNKEGGQGIQILLISDEERLKELQEECKKQQENDIDQELKNKLEEISQLIERISVVKKERAEEIKKREKVEIFHSGALVFVARTNNHSLTGEIKLTDEEMKTIKGIEKDLLQKLLDMRKTIIKQSDDIPPISLTFSNDPEKKIIVPDYDRIFEGLGLKKEESQILKLFKELEERTINDISLESSSRPSSKVENPKNSERLSYSERKSERL